MRFFILASLSFLSLSASALQTSYPLLCRGPLTLSIAGGEFLADFNRTAAGAGTTGEALKAGECAWMDRAVAPAEPNRIFVPVGDFGLPVSATSGPSAVNGATVGALFDKLSERQFLQDSLTNERVVIQLYVYNDGRYFKSETGKGTGRAFVIYPASKVAGSQPVSQASSPLPTQLSVKPVETATVRTAPASR